MFTLKVTGKFDCLQSEEIPERKLFCKNSLWIITFILATAVFASVMKYIGMDPVVEVVLFFIMMLVLIVVMIKSQKNNTYIMIEI